MRPFLSACFGLLAASVYAQTQPWPSQTYQTENFTIPQFVVNRPGTTDAGLLFLAYFRTADISLVGPMIVHDTGELVWRGETVTGDPAYNFHSQVLNGQTVLTYWSGFLDYQGHGFGNVTILDKQYNVIQNVCLPPSENSQIFNPRKKQYPGTVQYPCYLDKHESLITEAGTILVTTYNATQTNLTAVGGASDGWIWNCLFYELDLSDNSIVYKWSAIDHIDVTKSNYVNTTGNSPLFINGTLFGTKQQPWDWFHINSVQNIDGGYLVNSRMTWSTYKVNSADGSIDWLLEGSHGGSFTYETNNVFFSWQHMPRVESTGTNSLQVSMFNNDNIPVLAQDTNTSTGYLFNLNLNNMEATVLRDLQPASPIYAVAEGSYQALAKDHVLLGYGAIPIVQEFDHNNNIIYSGQFGPNAQGQPHSYRAYRLPWSSTPTTAPKIVASASKGVITAYMSWNGATTYDSWNVYAGPSETKQLLVASNVTKNGFETSTTFKKGKHIYKYVSAAALQNGKIRRKSSVVAVQSGT